MMPTHASSNSNNPMLMHGVGLAGAVFGALGIVVAVRKLLDTSPGLRLDEHGLTDNSSALAGGFVPWSEITGFQVQQIQRQRLLFE